ncbi:MAG TPA: peptidoglycan editing factor PgeF [Burkholderiales bacterium]|nr:peptidoglycan editing factor PgeF [Burkholderiales bacterium]
MLNNPNFLQANWNAPANIKTIITTRIGGYSTGQFDSLNLALHVSDNPEIVIKNRNLLKKYLPSEPFWLNQTHNNYVINLDNVESNSNLIFDASITSVRNKVCAILTADCLPILLTNKKGTFVAAIHAGWRGLLNNIIENTINMLKPDSTILAYIGPSICEKHFEVGNDVFNKFTNISPKNLNYFKEKTSVNKEIKYYCNLIEIAKDLLLNAGLDSKNIWVSNECTYCNNDLFYSYRKNNVTGRIASLIWLE